MDSLQVNPLALISELSGIIEQPVKSIEILPGGLEEWQVADLPSGAVQPNARFPFVYVEGNLGIPKKVLYGLYIAAIKVPKSSPLYPQASAIILVANPAHQTALNARKRLIRAGGLLPRKELTFTELLIRGSSEWAKQSIIWHHRRWIFGELYGEIDSKSQGCFPPTNFGNYASSEEGKVPRIAPSGLIAEFHLIRSACESYPRNYHAWTHWRIFVEGICRMTNSGKYFSEAEKEAYMNAVINEGVELRQWLNTHVSDYSAMYQLFCLAVILEDVPLSWLKRCEPLECKLLAKHAVELVESYPFQEALWLYLKMLYDKMNIKNREEILERLQRLTSGQDSHLFNTLLSHTRK